MGVSLFYVGNTRLRALENVIMRLNLLGKSLKELETLMDEWQQPRFRARQLFAGIYRRRLESWDRFTEFSKDFRETLGKHCAIQYPEPVQTFHSRDGTRRFLLAVAPDQRIESVFIPEERRDTVCISTQVGCAVECLFCVTGKLKMRRNLTPAEIVGQILLLQRERKDPAKRLNVVIMGMGEPLQNFDHVMTSLQLMVDSRGMDIPPRRITLSTAGVVPEILRLASESVIPNLAISLNATTDAVRDLLIPINKKWNIGALLDACRSFPLDKRRRITFEYVLIDGVNDSPEDARRLVSLLSGLPKRINLIPLNPDPWLPLKAPAESRVLDFQKILMDHQVSARIRKPRGDDISAACGMLAGREQAQGDLIHLPPKPAKASVLQKLGL